MKSLENIFTVSLFTAGASAKLLEFECPVKIIWTLKLEADHFLTKPEHNDQLIVSLKPRFISLEKVTKIPEFTSLYV